MRKLLSLWIVLAAILLAVSPAGSGSISLLGVGSQRHALGETQAEERSMTVWIYVDTSKDVGDRDHLKVFANADAAETWFEENDPERVAFEYEVLE
jgi:hypothetical protein